MKSTFAGAVSGAVSLLLIFSSEDGLPVVSVAPRAIGRARAVPGNSPRGWAAGGARARQDDRSQPLSIGHGGIRVCPCATSSSVIQSLAAPTGRTAQTSRRRSGSMLDTLDEGTPAHIRVSPSAPDSLGITGGSFGIARRRAGS